jgi:hypothetical protein
MALGGGEAGLRVASRRHRRASSGVTSPSIVRTYLQEPVFIAFSVQSAAEVASAAAPRTVLQAARARQNPVTSAIVTAVGILPLSLITGRMEIVG